VGGFQFAEKFTVLPTAYWKLPTKH